MVLADPGDPTPTVAEDRTLTPDLFIDLARPNSTRACGVTTFIMYCDGNVTSPLFTLPSVRSVVVSVARSPACPAFVLALRYFRTWEPAVAWLASDGAAESAARSAWDWVSARRW